MVEKAVPLFHQQNSARLSPYRNAEGEPLVYAFLERIFSGTFGGTAIMILVSAVIIAFLRMLYGPNGFLRDPEWDESPRRHCRKDGQKE